MQQKPRLLHQGLSFVFNWATSHSPTHLRVQYWFRINEPKGLTSVRGMGTAWGPSLQSPNFPPPNPPVSLYLPFPTTRVPASPRLSSGRTACPAPPIPASSISPTSS